MSELYDVPTDEEIRTAIESLEMELSILRSLEKLNDLGRLEAMSIVFKLAHTKEYMRKAGDPSIRTVGDMLPGWDRIC